MNYRDYINNSPVWKTIRLQKLGKVQCRCESCGATKGLEVHHLTYARLGCERMEDLMVLCYREHKLAEAFITLGVLPRTGDVATLRKRTLRILWRNGIEAKTAKAQRRREKGLDARNRQQQMLLSQPWFVESLTWERSTFKKFVKNKFGTHSERASVLANCFALFDRNAQLHAL